MTEHQVKAVAEAIAEQLGYDFAQREPGPNFGEELTQDDFLRAANAAIAAAGRWQSIESAPKQGRVLGIVDGDVRVIAYGKTSHVPIYGWCLADQGAEEFDLCEPTSWQPLPEPPPQS